MKRMIRPSASAISLSTALRRSSNSPRYLAPAISAPMSSATTRRSRSDSGTSPETMRCASPSAIAVLPTPGSPIRTGLFFVRRERTCIDAADLLVAPDHRVELALLGGLGEVAAELLERLVLVLGVLVGDAMRAAHAGHGVGQLVAGRADVHLRVARERQEQVLRGDVLVAERPRLLVGAAEQLDRRGGERRCRRGLAGDRRQRVERLVRARPHRLRVGTDPTQHRDDDAAVLLEQRDQEVAGSHLRVAASGGDPLRGGERLLRLDCESISLHKI